MFLTLHADNLPETGKRQYENENEADARIPAHGIAGRTMTSIEARREENSKIVS